MEKQEKNIDLYSYEVQEIIGRLPSWIVRRGIVTFGLILVLLIVGAAWFRYPDRVMSQIMITTENPPVFLMAKSSGSITRLFVNDKDTVQPGTVLAAVQSSGDYRDILSLEDSLTGLKQIFSHTDSIPQIQVDESHLGSAQSSFAIFQRSLADLSEFVEANIHALKITGLKNQLKNHQILYDRQYRSRKIHDEELKLEERNMNRMKQLLDSMAVTDVEWEKSQSQFLQAQLNSETARALLSETQIAIDDIKQNIDLEQKNFINERNALKNKVLEALENLQGDISEWKLNYLFISPIEGIVSFTQVWSENQYLAEGERVMNVVPYHTGLPIGKLQLPMRGSGKVHEGQTVLVMVDNFPYMEYGMLRGRVAQKSIVAEENYYSVAVVLDSGMVSTYGLELQFQQGMTGTAEIITEKMSFLVRIINPLKSVLNRNRQIN